MTNEELRTKLKETLGLVVMLSEIVYKSNWENVYRDCEECRYSGRDEDGDVYCQCKIACNDDSDIEYVMDKAADMEKELIKDELL